MGLGYGPETASLMIALVHRALRARAIMNMFLSETIMYAQLSVTSGSVKLYGPLFSVIV